MESDHELPAVPQWPAVMKWGSPPTTTLKPREQRPPPEWMASPPAMNFLNSPAVFFSSALAPSFSTALVSLVSAAPLTVLSAVTTTLFDTGSTATAVPGVLALPVREPRASFSSVSECATTLALAPASRTVSAALPSTTLTTRALVSLS